MSIYGSPTEPQNAATKNYVDPRDKLQVLKAGDTMTGDLQLGIGSDPVRQLGCADLSAGTRFTLTLGNFQNQLQFAVTPPPQSQTPVTMHTSAGLRLMMDDRPVCQLGDPGDTNQLIIHRRIAMNNNLIKFLHNPEESQDAATKAYVDTTVAQSVSSRKPLITIWAEESGTFGNGNYEWSFGNGSSGAAHANCGYTMMAPGRVLRMGLAVSTARGPPGAATVNIVVNGTENTAYDVTKPSGQYSGTSTFATPLELAERDRINFRSAITNDIVTHAVVSLLIELDP